MVRVGKERKQRKRALRREEGGKEERVPSLPLLRHRLHFPVLLLPFFPDAIAVSVDVTAVVASSRYGCRRLLLWVMSLPLLLWFLLC
ncbi:hypothetical protein PIB30_065032 [Stylosanthes scabra]|uniref:Uncharacterized protein n=1 Tax=Stylosanthes scabra TaxID=79078 RepID=A0ABU6QLU7_9FABA|nr:hypothetical protein [Stylosanthes scabra]